MTEAHSILLSNRIVKVLIEIHNVNSITTIITSCIISMYCCHWSVVYKSTYSNTYLVVKSASRFPVANSTFYLKIAPCREFGNIVPNTVDLNP